MFSKVFAMVFSHPHRLVVGSLFWKALWMFTGVLYSFACFGPWPFEHEALMHIELE